MNKLRVLSVLMILSVALFTFGCGGGGGSSASVEKDVVGITRTLNEFVAAARAGDKARLESLLASPGSYYLIIEDFGEDIFDPTDNESYEFYVNEEYIEQYSNDLAYVKAYYVLSTSETLWIDFALVREDGRWVIDEIMLDSPPDDSHYEPVGPTPLPSEFVVASFNPIDSGIEKIYAVEDGAGDASTTRLISSYGSGWYDSSSGITFHEFYEMYEEVGGASYEGFVPSNLIESGASLRKSLIDVFSKKINNVVASRRFSIRAQTEPMVAVYFGYDSSNALWLQMLDSSNIVVFNNGEPLKLFEPSHPYGTTRTLTYPFTVEGVTTNTSLTIEIGSPETLVTPLQTYTAVPVTYTDVDETYGAGSKWVQYFASGIGEVGYYDYDTLTSTTIFEKDLLLTRFNGDGSLNERNDPIITNTDTYLGAYQAGDTITAKQVTISGGTDPRVIQWYDPGTGAEVLLEGLSIDSNGAIIGTLAGTPALGTYKSRVMVKDKYGRYSARFFSIEVTDGSSGAATIEFSPGIPSTGTVGGPVGEGYFVMINSSSVPYSSYSFFVEKLSPSDPTSFDAIADIGVYDVEGYAKLSVYGLSDGVVTFRVNATDGSNSYSSADITIEFSSSGF